MDSVGCQELAWIWELQGTGSRLGAKGRVHAHCALRVDD